MTENEALEEIDWVTTYLSQMHANPFTVREEVVDMFQERLAFAERVLDHHIMAKN